MKRWHTCVASDRCYFEGDDHRILISFVCGQTFIEMGMNSFVLVYEESKDQQRRAHGDMHSTVYRYSPEIKIIAVAWLCASHGADGQNMEGLI